MVSGISNPRLRDQVGSGFIRNQENGRIDILRGVWNRRGKGK